jgi:hypothetical protein
LDSARRSLILPIVLVALAGAEAGTSPSSAGAAMVKQQVCSTRGLSFSYRSGSTTYSDKVSSLKASGASCATARSIATTVATKLLHKESVSGRVAGYAVHVKSPCSGCSPVWHVTAIHPTGKATDGSATLAFEVLGGA